MNLSRNGRILALGAVAVAGSLTLTACGSDDNSGATSAPSTSAVAANSGAASGGSSSAAGGVSCASGSLALHGSTAQANAISQWTKDYQTACPGATINYTADGSGAGYTAFVGKQADFAGSDYALDPSQQPDADKRCAPGKASNLPLVPGAIALMYNVPGVPASTHLKLSAETLAQIFTGKITKWDDPAIAKANPGVKLPSTKIQTFHRSDGSGTSYNLSNYLHHLAPKVWKKAANKQWPSSPGQGDGISQGEKGSAAVTQAVKSTSGGIGYAEYSYATQSHLATAALGNAKGQFVPISQKNAANFIAKAKVSTKGTSAELDFDYGYAAPDAYPATLVTYEFVCSSNNGDKGKLIKSFLTYMASDKAQGELDGLGYVPLPASVDSTVSAAIAKITAN